ncbi:hypothetical protein [Ammoniphilus sp. YIM 78166]|uniref:hypothetical protein n=1 Tax=Ammoniphilus sp. YIM 78166 TaxID=1644106 RepID=UPI00142FB4D8|nr:hypothetical protein [Ammoniphilus sp. YIM 78166]
MIGGLGGHQTMALVPGSGCLEAWRASNGGFGALIKASVGLAGIKRRNWCPDLGFGRPRGHQTKELVPGCGLREVWRASNDGFGARIWVSGGMEGIKRWFWCPD